MTFIELYYLMFVTRHEWVSVGLCCLDEFVYPLYEIHHGGLHYVCLSALVFSVSCILILSFF